MSYKRFTEIRKACLVTFGARFLSTVVLDSSFWELHSSSFKGTTGAGSRNLGDKSISGDSAIAIDCHVRLSQLFSLSTYCNGLTCKHFAKLYNLLLHISDSQIPVLFFLLTLEWDVIYYIQIVYSVVDFWFDEHPIFCWSSHHLPSFIFLIFDHSFLPVPVLALPAPAWVDNKMGGPGGEKLIALKKADKQYAFLQIYQEWEIVHCPILNK